MKTENVIYKLILGVLFLWSNPIFAQNSCDINVPEASNYTLVYTLPIPVNSDYDGTLPPYSVDNAASIGTFDRVAYCVELDNQWIWVSLDAFTTVPAQVGVPVRSTGAIFQRLVSNMNVESNVPGIVTGTGITTGNMEFWHNCYSFTNAAGIPGASSSVYDFGDRISTNVSCYGSMQLHNFGAKQTLFAYNTWDHRSPDDLGIGNNTVITPVDNRLNLDWTFRTNAGTYSVRNMHILVRTDTDIEKLLLGGPDEIGIYLPEPTSYFFEIAYTGPAALVVDTAPAEFECVNPPLAPSAGSATCSKTGKSGKSANRIEWNVPAGSNTLVVEIQTVASPGKGHKAPVFKPTSCGPLPINDGATAFEVDENGELVLAEVVDLMTGEVTLERVVIVGPSNSLQVEAVEGDKPCVEEEEEAEEEDSGDGEDEGEGTGP